MPANHDRRVFISYVCVTEGMCRYVAVVTPQPYASLS
jgi:hypothetical protein